MPLTATSSLSVIAPETTTWSWSSASSVTGIETKSALDCNKDRRLLSASDQRAVGNLPGTFTGGKKADPYRGGLPGA